MRALCRGWAVKVAAALLSIVLVALVSSIAQAQKRPNILVI